MTIARGRGRAVLLGAVGLVLSGLTACGSGSGGGPAPEPTPVPGATPGGKLTIGIAFDQPGIGLKQGDAVTGFDADTATYIAKALGVPPENITWKEAKGDERQRLLDSGGADLIVSTFTITEERKQAVDFAGPYFVAHQDLLVRRNEEDITGPETLTGKTLCSVPGTTSADTIATRYGGTVRLKEFPRYSDCVTALAAGDVDAVTTDDVILAGFASEPQYRGRLKLLGKGFTDERYGIGVRKGDTAMVQKVTAALQQYVADGSWQRSLDATVRPSGYSIPSPPTVGGP
ncbi:MAG TPA: glutamate ABC transporter substrate-binding protein [Pseudonocardia sp.]|jgi:glutamate transport system substrate-binding protein